MAIGDPYVSRDALKEYLKFKDNDDVDNDLLDDVMDSITAEINNHTGRQFNDAGSASARVYRTEYTDMLLVDDFHTTTGLIIKTDDDADGIYETTWESDEYQLEPLNGVVEGVPGWPYWVIRAVDGERQFPVSSTKRALAQVTARWGWASVPKPVLQSYKILASDTFGLKDTRFGLAGSNEFGGIRVGENASATRKLQPYIRIPVLT